jgi:tetratricopeptide (TPR) repeat protein
MVAVLVALVLLFAGVAAIYLLLKNMSEKGIDVAAPGSCKRGRCGVPRRPPVGQADDRRIVQSGEYGALSETFSKYRNAFTLVNDADIEYNLGICLSELGRVKECLAPLQRCIELDPNQANAHVGLGVAHARLGNSEAAEAALRVAVRLEPENAYAKRNLAGLLARHGRHLEALPFFQ